MVDPWAYRDRLTMPKLIINGTNDFYWATDALNLYWHGIPAGKWVHYVPNAGHNLRRQDRPKADQSNDLIASLAAFSRHQISGIAMPKMSWKHEVRNGKLRLTMASSPAPVAARLWIAERPTADFRAAQWIERPLFFLRQPQPSPARWRRRPPATWRFLASSIMRSTACATTFLLRCG